MGLREADRERAYPLSCALLPAPHRPPTAQVAQRRQLAVALRLRLLLPVLPRLLAHLVSRAGGALCCAACAGRWQFALHSAWPPPPPARPLSCPAIPCLLPLPACSFGKQYDKEGAYIRRFLPVLKVGSCAGWGGEGIRHALAACSTDLPSCVRRPPTPAASQRLRLASSRRSPLHNNRRTCRPSTFSSRGRRPPRCRPPPAASSARTTRCEGGWREAAH